MSSKNPALGIVNTITEISKGCNPITGVRGKIIKSPPEIEIAYNDAILDKKDIWISEYLLKGYERTAKGHIVSETQPRSGGGGYAEFASHTHEINNDYTDNIIYTDTLKPGDYVAMLPIDGTKQYFVLDKVVQL